MTRITIVTATVLALTACYERPLSWHEARDALQESTRSDDGEQLVTEPIEISTDFTIGQGLQQAAEELAAFWQSQAPCAEVTHDGGTVIIDYGTLDDACTWRDHTYAGIHQIHVAALDDDTVQVEHDFLALTNGEITLDGKADVQWHADTASRDVQHYLLWTDADQRVLEASGERTQALLDADEGLSGGIVVDGMRDWTFTEKTWHLDILGVQMRLQDPVPQAGTYVLTIPDGRSLEAVFTRLDEDRIQIDVTGTRRPWTFIVGPDGSLE